MRKPILWSVGFASLNWLTGCGLFQGGYCENCQSQLPPTHLPRQVRVQPYQTDRYTTVVAQDPAKPTRTVVKGNDYRGSVASRPIETSRPQLITPAGTTPTSKTQAPDSKAESTPFKVEYVPPVPIHETMPIEKIVILEPGKTAEPPMAETPMPLPNIEVPNAKDQAVVPQNVEIEFGHGPNFETVTGQVHSFRKTWRLRYAPIGQEDPLGGSVLLEGGEELNKLRDGQQVRIRGTLLPSTDRSSPPRYRVQAVEALD